MTSPQIQRLILTLYITLTPPPRRKRKKKGKSLQRTTERERERERESAIHVIGKILAVSFAVTEKLNGVRVMERVQPGKRKRAAKSSDIRRMKPKDGADGGLKSQPSTAEARPPPSEEEVEEFFAILGRMHVAVRYLERTGQSLSEIEGGERHTTGEVEALEEEEEEVAAVRISQKEDANGGFDLNRPPDAESDKSE